MKVPVHEKCFCWGKTVFDRERSKNVNQKDWRRDIFNWHITFKNGEPELWHKSSQKEEVCDWANRTHTQT